jgi:hypothetical protein
MCWLTLLILAAVFFYFSSRYIVVEGRNAREFYNMYLNFGLRVFWPVYATEGLQFMGGHNSRK